VSNLVDSKQELETISSMLPEFERVVEHMRRTANKLQLHVAAKNISDIVRDLRIFYGLNHLVRPELLRALAQLSKQDGPLAKEAEVFAPTIPAH
jgi:hypothetical protein